MEASQGFDLSNPAFEKQRLDSSFRWNDAPRAGRERMGFIRAKRANVVPSPWNLGSRAISR
jgi:hypothetical protein